MNKPIKFGRAYNHQFEVFAGWDESERIREDRNGRIYVSSSPRRVYLCRLSCEKGEVDGMNFDRLKDAVAFGNKWLDAAN